MAFDRDKEVSRVFDSLGADNPLKELTQGEQRALWALGIKYQKGASTETDVRLADALDEAEKAARDANQIAGRIESVLRDPTVEIIIDGLSVAFERLPEFLRAFGGAVLEKAPILGKPGYKDATFRTSDLVMASEFVRLKTGHYNDEPLADLLQAVSDDPAPTKLSGEAIRRRRTRFKEEYPEFNDFSIRQAKALATNTSIRSE